MRPLTVMETNGGVRLTLAERVVSNGWDTDIVIDAANASAVVRLARTLDETVATAFEAGRCYEAARGRKRSKAPDVAPKHHRPADRL